MDIAVCVKQIIDTEAEIELDENQQVITDGQTLIMDPYSEFAVEKSVQLKEELGGRVVLVCLGDEECASAIRHGLAMGADEAILLARDDWRQLDPGQKVACLSQALSCGGFDLIMGGWKSGDTANAQVMAGIAAALQMPLVNMATSLEVEGSTLTVTCEVDDGTKVLQVSTPAVIAAQQGLAEPRYPSVRDVMQARRKKIETRDASAHELPAAKIRTIRMEMKPPRQGGRVLEGELAEVCAQAASLLRREAKVI